jgi:hypothetical protein
LLGRRGCDKLGYRSGASVSEENDEAIGNRTVVIDFGKQKRKRVKDLRKGRGKLMDRVEATVAEVEAEGVVAPGAQTVIVVVERKPEPMFPGF